MISSSYELCLNIEIDTNNKTLFYIIDKNKKIPLDITNIESKIIIFEQEVKGWLFQSIEELLNKDIEFIQNSTHKVSFKHGIFILFGIFAYMEKMQLYRGDLCPGSQIFCSGHLIKNGIKRLFSDEVTIAELSEDELKKVVIKTRNNLMHEAMIGDDVLLNYSSENFISPISIHKNDNQTEIRIAPIPIFKKIHQDFDNYLEILRNSEDEDLKNKFIEKFDNVYKQEIDMLK